MLRSTNMNIQIISDIHLEFGSTEWDFSKADVVVLAGDTHVGTKGVEWAKKYIPSVPVIYILGNHEYYKGSYPKTLHKIQEVAKGSNVIVLENDRIDLDGIRFHGATLWTDFSLLGDPVKYGMLCQSKMSDYKLIRRDPSYSKLRTIDTYHIHQQSKRWLQRSLEESIGHKNIVITHHAPSIRSLPEPLQNKETSAAYASNLEDMILEFQPDYWIHGHIHTPIQYHIGKTKIICNPHGYISDTYNGFEKEFFI